MDFGYFTLSDNHYENNPRSANQFVADITAEALYADQIGMHSAWIGEHHFNSLGVLSSPDLVLAYIAARTKHIRLAPAVTVLPLHHPIRVAEQWATLDLLSNGRVDFAAGRGYDKREYLPFHVSFENNQSIFDEGLELVRKLWQAEERISLPRQALLVRGRAHHAETGAAAHPDLCRVVLEAFHRACGAAGLRPDRGAVCGGHELRRAQAGRRPLPRELREVRQPSRRRLMCSYFTHFADNKAAGRRAARPPNPLLPGMRDSRLPRRSEDRAAELSLFHRHGGKAAARCGRKT